MAWLLVLLLVRPYGEGAILQRNSVVTVTTDLDVYGTIYSTSSQGIVPCCGTSNTEQELTLTGLPSVLTQYQTYTVTIGSISVTARQVGVLFSNGSAYLDKLYPTGNMFTVANRTINFTLTASTAGPLTMVVNAFPGIRTFNFTVIATATPNKYYRLEILSVRTPYTVPSGLAFSELQLTDPSNASISTTGVYLWTSATGTVSASEVISQAFDGSTATKYCLMNQAVYAEEMPSTAPALNVYMNLTTATFVCGFTMYTANDSPGRDPMVMRFYTSTDGAFWMPLSSRLQSPTADPGRFSMLAKFFMC